jgi:aspartate carbamoyltransferase catalytic subunit
MGAEVMLSGPPTLIPKYIQQAFDVQVEYDLQKALHWCDVANVLRIQLERQNQVLFSNTIGQFSGNSNTYLQINNQNFNSNMMNRI